MDDDFDASITTTGTTQCIKCVKPSTFGATAVPESLRAPFQEPFPIVCAVGSTSDPKRAIDRWSQFMPLSKYKPLPEGLRWGRTASVDAIEKGLSRKCWGPMMYFGQARDLDMTDFPSIVDDVYALCTPPHKLPDVHFASMPHMVKGVRINCKGDVQYERCCDMETAAIPLEISDFASLIRLPIGEKIKIPLWALKIAPAPSWVKYDAPEFSTEGTPGVLHSMINNMCPLTVLDPPGTVIIVRGDRKPLEIQHVRALVTYCDALGQRYHSQRTTDIKLVRDLCGAFESYLEQHVTSYGFHDFYQMLMVDEKYKVYREEFGVVQSPYDVGAGEDLGCPCWREIGDPGRPLD
ncbi:hypothetical protein P280DRAFT_509129 [Massarina eburnea CBS 473.64]|uniref:Uncharacterized protein n=1 Tax=Massarina eburnea CBS 473.64 TaxID=1395130 RepID=A0A6A6RSE0_9PLEO|nr:hypothetical protein P280DRAFT_509129 [Massarina eburnea CBS 473.64]